MHARTFHIVGADNPLIIPAPMLHRLAEKAAGKSGSIRPNGTLRVLTTDEQGHSERGMCFPCEWLAAGRSLRLALIRNPYPDTPGQSADFLLCLPDGRVFTAAANAALGRLIAYALAGQLKTADSL